jgi:gamma-glutamyltranspeptidase
LDIGQVLSRCNKDKSDLRCLNYEGGLDLMMESFEDNVNGMLNYSGALAVAVPGELAGYREAHQRYGRLPWPRLVLPSVLLASNGLPVNSDLARILRNEAHNVASEPSLS